MVLVISDIHTIFPCLVYEFCVLLFIMFSAQNEWEKINNYHIPLSGMCFSAKKSGEVLLYFCDHLLRYEKIYLPFFLGE